MANTKYDNRTRQQIASDVLDEEGGGLLGLFKTTGRYISGDFPRSESRDDVQGKVNRRRKGMEVLKQREAEGKRRAARLKREKEQQIAKNEEARKERVRAREQAKIDRQAASVSGRALNADEKKAIADMKRRERLAQQESASQSKGVLRSSANPPAKTNPAANTSSTPGKPASKSTPASSGPEWKKYKSVAAAKKAGSRFYTGSDGKKKLAITKEELGRKKGETLTQAYNRFEGKTSRKASSASSSSSSSANKSSNNKSSNNKSTTKKNETKKVGGIRRLLLGPDGKFGGPRGLVDFLPGKSRTKYVPNFSNKAGGGMMKSKMASKGGARGGRKPTGMKAGGSLEMTMVGGRKVPAFAADGKGSNDLAKKAMGGMMKSKMASKGGAKGGRKPSGMKAGGVMKSKMASKGGAKGGRKPTGMNTGGMPKKTKKGYANGGVATKKGMAKGGATTKKKAVSRKPRGVGAALRGYGKALK